MPGSLVTIPCHCAKSIPYKRPRAWGRRREARRSSSAGSGRQVGPERREDSLLEGMVSACAGRPEKETQPRSELGAKKKGARGALGQEARPASAEYLQFN